MSGTTKHIYKFGPFRLDTKDHVLLRDGEHVPLALKSFKTLLVLVENSGRVVERGEFLTQVWANAFVEEANLTQQIFTLRKVLGSDQNGRQYIETVPKLGYRFAATVSKVPNEASSLEEKNPAEAQSLTKDEGAIPPKDKTIDSIAVLPLANVSNDPDTEYLSDGITESIISNLSQLSQLRVMARSTVFHYKGREIDPQKIGRDLNVQAVVTGRIVQLGDNLIFRVELVDVTDGSQLWGKEYRRQLSDIFEVQEELSMAISKRLQIKLTGENRNYLPKHHTHNIEAYKLYLKGRYFWNKRTAEQVKRGIKYFEQVIEEDPTYAMAYVGLADSYVILGSYSGSPPTEAFPKAKAMATKALEIDGLLAEARTSLAYAIENYDWDWLGAEKEYKRAIKLNPNYATAHHWYGKLLAKTQRYAQAMIELKRAQELDPLSLIINTETARVFYYMGRYDKAMEQCIEMLEMDSNFCAARALLAMAYERKGMKREAIAECKKLVILSKGDAEVIACLGNFYATSGKTEQALTVLDRLKKLSKQRYVSPFHIAIVYTGLRHKDQALEWLEKAYEERSSLITYLKVEPMFENLNSDPSFTDLLQRIGLAS
jgi:TolB-like protein/Tfp pilus assembly protein PilF